MGSRHTLLLFTVLTASLQAQSPLGTVTGVATDPAGAAVPNVAIALTNTGTGAKHDAITNDAGVYSIPNLAPGSYKLKAEEKGFQALEIETFPVMAYRTVRQDLRLVLAATATEVTVTESASTVTQVDTPAIALSLSARQILDLPTNLRSIYNNAGDSGVIFTMMPLTIPGVVQVANGAKWLVPGGGANGMKLKVDGIETNFGNFGSPDPVSQPSMESIEEFTANVQTNRAEFGGLGAITTVTRAGTNEFHPSLFWYLRNSSLDARNAFAVAKPFQNIHNYGASVAGPLKKDRTFFFTTFDGTRGSRAYLFTANVPTLAMRQGDFTGMGALRNPYTDFDPFDGSRIKPQYLSPQALAAQDQFYPLPNFGAPNLAVGNYRASFNGPEVHRIFEIRLDHTFSSRHSAFARYQHKKDDYKIPGARTGLPPSSVGTSTNIRRVNFWTIGDIYSIRPNLFNEFRAGLVILVSESEADLNGRQLLDEFGIKGLPPRPGAKGIPNISVTGLTSVGQLLLNPVNDGHAQFSDNVTWIAGRHTLKFGGEVIPWFVNRYLPAENALFGNFSFTNRFTGQPYADFLLGLPTTVTRLDPYYTQYNRFTDVALYLQDDFKLTPKLTLNYGLRYEYNQPVRALDGNIYSFDLTSGSIVTPSADSRRLFSPYLPATIPVITADNRGLGEGLRAADKNNWAPRFGFSYQLGSKARTVLRGGWGVYYAHFSGNVAGGLAAGPFAISTTSTNNFVNGQPLFTFANPFASPGAPGAMNLNAISPTLGNSRTMQYTLSVEHEIVRDLGIRVSYIGSKSTRMVYRRNVNQPAASTTPFTVSRRPYALYNNIIYSDNGANGYYSGLQTQVSRRFTRGLHFTSAWTWAKSIAEIDDTGDFELNTLIENTYDRRRERANLYSVPRHQWMNQVLWELPLRPDSPALRAIAGGWQVNTLVNLQSGNFLNPVFSGSDPSNTNTIGGRPDVVKPGIDRPETLTAWYDRTAFAAPPANAGRFGNAGRNLVQGPGYVVFNFGVQKNIRQERYGLIQVGASFQNILNHPNYGEPNMTVNVPAGGTITATHIFPAAGSPRTGQISLRWNH